MTVYAAAQHLAQVIRTRGGRVTYPEALDILATTGLRRLVRTVAVQAAVFHNEVRIEHAPNRMTYVLA